MRNLICVCLLASSPVLYADSVYKWVDEDGKVIYSEEPPIGIDAEEIKLPSESSSTTPGRKKGESVEERQQRFLESSRELSRQTNERIERRKTLQSQLRAAEKELKAAKKALEDGQAPQEGERVKNVGGGTRLGPAYYERIKRLEAKVKNTEAKVDGLRKELRSLGR